MASCLKHLKGFDKSLYELADSNKDSHHRIDRMVKGVEGLKKRVVDLESRNILVSFYLSLPRATFPELSLLDVLLVQIP